MIANVSMSAISSNNNESRGKLKKIEIGIKKLDTPIDRCIVSTLWQLSLLCEIMTLISMSSPSQLIAIKFIGHKVNVKMYIK